MLREKLKKKPTGLLRVIFTSSMICMLIPLIIVSIISIRSLSKNLETTYKENLQQLSIEKMNEVNFVLQNQIQITKAVAESPYVAQEVASGANPQKMIDYLVSVFNNAGTLYENFFITKDSMGFADGLGGVTLHDVTGEPWYEICKTSREFLGNNISPVTGRPVYVISYGVYHNGQFVGGLNNSIDTGNMTKDIINSLKDDNKTVLIIDSEGNIIASEKEEQILKINLATENDSTIALFNQMKKVPEAVVEFQFNGTTNLGAYSSMGGMYTLVFMPMKNYTSKINMVIHSIGVVVILCIIGAVVLIFITSISITRPIKIVNQSMQEIATGDADLTKRINLNAKYEVGALVDGFNTFSDKMQSLVSDIKGSTTDLNDAGSVLESSTFDTESSITEIMANIDSVNIRIHKQNEIVDEAATAMNQILISLEELEQKISTQSTGVNNASDEIEGMLQNISDVNSSISSMVNNFNTLRENIETGSNLQKEVSNYVETIGNQSKSLQEANIVISGIASQTNLLAMNAAIEAAHAGELGKGFSVVADEIRKLSENSNIQSKKINQMIKEIRATIDTIVNATKLSQSSFDSIANNVSETDLNVHNIQTAMEKQQQGSNQISMVLKDITESTKQVFTASNEIASGTKNINVQMQNLQDSAIEMEQSISEMKIGAKKINETGAQLSDITKMVKNSINKSASEVDKFKI